MGSKIKNIALKVSLLFLIATFFVLLAGKNAVAATCSHNVTTRTILPGCTTRGYTEAYCSKCGTSFSKTDYKPAKGHYYQPYDCKRDKCSRPGCTSMRSGGKGHSPEDDKVLQSATCTKSGVMALKCSVCGDGCGSRTIPKKGHSFSEYDCTTDKCTRYGCSETRSGGYGHKPKDDKVLQEATCTRPGVVSRICNVCGAGCGSRTIPAKDHIFSAYDCTTDKCTRYGCSETRSGGKGHSPVDDKVLQEATCTRPGVVSRICSVCHAGCGSRTISAKNHSFSAYDCTTDKCTRTGCAETRSGGYGHTPKDDRVQKSPTCSEEGIMSLVCGECGAGCGSRTIPKAKHQIFHNTKQATCTEDGYDRYGCPSCGYVESEIVIPKTGHSTKIVYTEPECNAPGYRNEECTVCEKLISSIPYKDPIGHDYKNYNCTQDKCSRCNSIISGGYGHTPVDYRAMKTPKCEEAGVMALICDECGAGCGSREIPATGHSQKVIYTEAECNVPGYKNTICKNCEKVFSSIPYEDPLGHDYKNYDCTHDKCSRCDSIISGGYGHTPVDYRVMKEATCKETGVMALVCDVCNAGCGSREIEKREHKVIYTSKKATCLEEGYERYGCPSCDYVESETIYPKTDHVIKTTYTEPTCYEPGFKQEKCTVCQKVISNHPYKDPINHDYYPGTDICRIGSCPKHSHIYDIYISNSVARRCICGATEPRQEPGPGNEDYPANTTPDSLQATNVGTVTEGDPVNTYTGAHEIDFKVISAGGAQSLTLGLSYKSNKSIYGIFGKGFSWNYESYITEEDGDIKLFRSPTEYVVYKKDAETSNYYTDAVGSENDEITKNGDGSYKLSKDGRTFIYDSAGRFIEITEKNGSKTQIEYFDDHTELIDGISGQKITLYLNDKKLVEKVTNSGTAKALFEYDKEGRLVKFTDVDGFVTQYTYDDYDRVLTGTDNDGNVFFVDTYDEKGRIVKQKDASGAESSFSYTDNGESGKTTVFTDRNGNTKTHTFSKEGRLLSLTDEEGNTTFSEYDEGGNCIKKTDALGNSNLMEYDDRHNLVKVTDALGNVTKFAYDENDNPIKITYPNGSEVISTYDSNNRLVSTTDVRGLTTTNTYDDNGFLIKTESGDKVSTLTYENGNLKTVTDSLGNVTTYTYDKNGNLIETKAPDGAVISQTVSDYGAVKSIKDALNNEKFYTRNCFDKPLSVKDEAGYETKYSYDERQLLSESKDSKKNVTSYAYDNEERLVKTTYPDGTYTENVYDKAGRLVETVDAEGNRTSVEYDKAGRVVKETDREGNSTEISYDANGNVISRKDAKGNVTTYTYDEMGRVSTVTNAFKGVTKYTYNDAGDLLSVKAPMGEVTYYTYDIYGRKTSETDPNGNVTRFEYDLNGNLIKSIDAINNEVTYEYDECNRLVSTKSGDAVVTLEYDLNGRGIATTDPLGHRSETTFDNRGYASVKKDALGNVTSYTYDSNGNLVSVTDANGHTTTYAVNNVNQVISVTDALELTTSYAYDKNGRRNKSTNPIGGVSTCIFDKTGNALTLTGPEGATTDFTYDANGNLASRSTVDGNSVKYTYNALNLAESFTNGREQTTTYEYDLNGRIVKTVSPESTVTYTYDGNSNVLTVTDETGSIERTYDALNRVTSVTDTKGRVVSYEYDSYGNLKTLTYPDNTSVSYTYDLCGNIKTVTDWEGRVTAYAYDALNREIQAVTTSNKEDFSIDLSSYGKWESGEYSDSTGEKADHRRRMRYPELIDVDSSAYSIGLSEGYKLRICEYNEYGSFIGASDVKGGGVYNPTEYVASFSITLIKLEGEKSLSPGQWNGLFSKGVTVSLSASRRGNGTTVTKEYDAVGNLVKTTARKNTTGAIIDETIYEYDEINRLVSESRPHRNFKYVYEYDDLSRVTKRSTITLSTGESCYDEVFEYDGAGNINAAEYGDNRNNLAYNTADNRIESFNNLGFGFDNDGNMTSMAMAEGTSLDVEGIKAKGINAILNYDSHNRLISGIIDAKGTVADLNIDATAKLFSNYGYDAEDYRTYSSFNVGVYPDLPDGLKLPDSLESVPEAETVTDITDEPENDTVSDDDMISSSDTVSGNNAGSGNDAVSDNDSVPGKEIQEESNEENNDVSEGDILPVMPEPETDTDSFKNGEITVLSGNIETEEVSDSEETEVTAEDVSENAESGEQEISAEPEEEKLDEESVSENTTSSLEERLINRIDESSLEDIVTKEENCDSITSAMEPTAILEYAEGYEYCYDRENKNLLVRYSEDGTLEKYVYGNGLIASSETRESQSPKYRTYLYDLRGSVTFTLDSSANITSEYQYSTYGTRGVVKGNTTSELGYCARDGVLTEVTGLLYMRARYYMPELMRFINQDIVTGDISNSNSLNRYTYVEGNPATLIDPFGLCAERAGSGFWNTVHNIFDIAGFIPGIGDICDGFNGIIYAFEGDWANAGLSLTSMIPVLGDVLGKGGKTARQAIKALSKMDNVGGITKSLVTHIDEGLDFARKHWDEASVAATKVLDKAESTARKVLDKFDDTVKKLFSKTDEAAGAVKGSTKTKPNQVHHFATNKSKKYTSQFENIANKYNLDLDGAWNKELMPHQGRHPNAYHDYVLDNMQKFDKIAQGDQTKFLQLYDQMKQKIISNPDMLYKNYWINQ